MFLWKGSLPVRVQDLSDSDLTLPPTSARGLCAGMGTSGLAQPDLPLWMTTTATWAQGVRLCALAESQEGRVTI